MQELAILFGEIRQARGLSCLELARKAKLKVRRIVAIEDAKHDFSIGDANTLAVALGVPLHQIFKEAEERASKRRARAVATPRRKVRRSRAAKT